MRAADLWADGRNSGHPRDDADLIIAATALEAGRVLVTGNTQHFAWIPGLRLADWRCPNA
jgi:predicted nucleic acid-binding protein